MKTSILTSNQEEILKRERQWLTDLQQILNKLNLTEDEQTILSNSIKQLDELFLLVVVGEFNAGKSALINTLLGEVVLKEGVTPTTAQINVLKYGAKSNRVVEEVHLHYLTEPLEFLRHINIVDTPGTNAIIQEHQEITEEFVPRSDLVLFVTSADRPFTESERNFLNRIREWGKKVVIIINKIDIFETEADMQKVIDFVKDNGLKLLDIKPEVFPISGKLAMKAKQGQTDLWSKSRFEALEGYIEQTLDETTRFQLKLQNPLGIGGRFIKQYGDIVTNRLAILVDDLDTLDTLDRQLQLYREDMERDFEFRLADIENVLYDMEKRGNEYFDDTLRIGRFFDLLQKSYIQKGFEQKVVANVPDTIEQKVATMVDWLVNADLHQWQTATDYLKARKDAYQSKIIGEVGQGFRYDRDRLIDSVGRSAQRVVDTYDKTIEAEKIAIDAQMAVAGTAIAGGVVGLGAVLVALTTTMALDVTGVITAVFGGVMGLLILPRRRKAAKEELNNRLTELRLHLIGTLTNQFNKELERSVDRIKEAIGPYTRFVRSERDKLSEIQTDIVELERTQARLNSEIEALNG
ncbi:dynamin family protein [Anaerolineales bacterium HSG6]|nr:dynamin family protein [Anaerolineales bacterium HSG6]MDM8532840.1 dynamin family protein [Anaerolineales bacterium HSG25]